MSKPLAPGSSIGILGGGQLGRMLSVAASRLGFKTHIFEPGASPPAEHVAHRLTTAAYDNELALTAFANSVDVITFEFENIPAQTLDLLENIRSVLPRRNALAVSQDRILEKNFLNEIGLGTAPYANIETPTQLDAAVAAIGTPSILKTRRFGYDGKGQIVLRSPTEAQAAWEELDQSPCVLEGFVNFSKEVSVIGARSQLGSVVCFDPGENEHRSGILHKTQVPANITQAQRESAIHITETILNALDYRGVMGVELFVTESGLLINEIAPRVHNSGHWTMNGCVIDQFEQHMRAVAGWPLGDGQRHSDIEMVNLIGSDVESLSSIALENTGLHLYGKAEVKAGRKMGHVNRVVTSK